MNVNLLAILTVTSLLLGGCTASPLDFQVPTSTMFWLDRIDAEDGVQTANPGDVVHRQSVSVRMTARLDDAVRIRTNENTTIHHTVNAGTTLFAVQLPSFAYPGFCTTELTAFQDYAFGENVGKSCFVDLDQSGSFDHAYMTFENYVTETRPYTTGGMLNRGVPLDAPAAYTLLDTSDLQTAELGIVYSTRSDRDYYFYTAKFNTEGVPERLYNGSDDGPATADAIEPNQSFPQTLRVLNIEIEVMSFDDGQVTYQVRPATSEREAITLP